MALFQRLASAVQRISLGVDESLDLQRQFHIASAVQPLACSALVGLKLWKLCLPEAQNLCFHLADTGHVSNLEVEAVGDRRFVNNALAGKLCAHNDGERPRHQAAGLTLNAV